MTFLTPFMLIGVLAAGIPVAIHLFFRSRYRTVPWAAMKFLLTSVEQTSRRLRFQELLLLLLRMFILVMLAFAFMRPISTVVRGAGRGDAVDAVFVFDLSYSMGGKDEDGKTRLMHAKEEAIKILEELPAHSTVQIVTCSGADKAKLGPHSPANLDQAKQIIDGLDITSLDSDLYQGVAEAEDVLKRGQASNKELYVFSDMQKLGLEQNSGELKRTLLDIKEKALVHFVRCGTRTLKNVAVIDIKPQSGVPRPGERVGFAVLVRNSGLEAMTKLKVSLAVDGDDKNVETTEIPKINPSETYAVTLTAKLAKPGLRVLTAGVMTDDLTADNRFDQVIQVRDQVNLLVVDGGYNEREPSRSSSYFLMHALLPVKEGDRATYPLQPRVIPARLASPALLARQDLCILVNVSLQAKGGARSEVLPSDFVDALGEFVRKGHGLIVFAGDNVQPEPYNRLLGKKVGLLPMPLKGVVKAAQDKPFLIDRTSFGPPTFWKFKDDDYYKDFAKVEVWQSLAMDESAPKAKKDDTPAQETPTKDDDEPVNVVVRLNNGTPLIAAKKVDAGEVIFVGTAAEPGSLDAKTFNPSWTDWPLRLALYVPFIDVLTSHLLHGQTHTYNLVAGQTLNWFPPDKLDYVYSLVHPDKSIERLKAPEKVGKRVVVTKTDLARAGVYRMIAQPRSSEGSDTADVAAILKGGMPIAVTPNLRESEDLSALSDNQIDEQLGFEPVHLIAGALEVGATGADRLNREWTVWVLLAVLGLVLIEVAFAWWCGRAW